MSQNNINTKKIYLEIPGRIHSLYFNLINYPPDGYAFICRYNLWDSLSEKMARNKLFDLMRIQFNKIIPVNIVKSILESGKSTPYNSKLTYSAGHLIFRNEPWLVDLEFVTQLSGYNKLHFKKFKNRIAESLSSKLCKKILPWTNMGAKTIQLAFDDQEILHKIETVHLAVPPKNFIKKFNDEKVKLLFVSSQNFPHDFEIKGGREVLEAFSKVVKSYDNVELTVRSYVPSKLRKRFGSIKNLKIIDSVIPWQQLEQEFKTSDIFLFPSHNTPGLAILDAMSYELPVITTDLWANSEMIQNGRNGILIPPSKEICYFEDDLIPKWGDPGFLEIIRNYSIDVDPLVSALCKLIDNPELRRRMGKEGRKDIEMGEFSIMQRNIRLKKIFDAIE